LIRRLAPSSQQILTLALTLLGVAVAWLLGNFGLSAQFRVALLGVVALVFIFLLASRTSLRLHLWLMLGTLAFGWRTEYVAGVMLDAQQVVAWLLLAHLLIVAAVRRLDAPICGLPLALLTLAAGGLGFLTGLSYGRAPSSMLTELGPLILSVPVIVGLSTLVTDRAAYRQIERGLILVILAISLPGIVEYALVVRSGISGTALVFSQMGFARANFTAWGGTVAGYGLSVLSLLMLSPLLRPGEAQPWRILAGIAFSSGVAAVYLTSHRGALLALIAGLLAFTLLARRGRLLISAATVVAWFLLPESVQRGLEALRDPSLTGLYDSSALGRYSRIEAVWRAIRSQPLLGRGLTSSGWVHADILQLAANLGVPAALALLLAWFYPVPALLRRNRRHWLAARANSEAQTAHLQISALLAAALAALILLATQALIVISALALPVYIVIGLLHARRHIEQNENDQPG